MAKPINFPEQNSVAGGNGEVSDLPVYRDGVQTVSCWTFTPEEILEIQSTGRVYLCVMGNSMPAALITGTYPFERTVN